MTASKVGGSTGLYLPRGLLVTKAANSKARRMARKYVDDILAEVMLNRVGLFVLRFPYFVLMLRYTRLSLGLNC